MPCCKLCGFKRINMSLLYKDPKYVIISVEVITKEDEVEFIFLADCGKHGTHEIIDGYKLTPERLMAILQDRSDYSEDELQHYLQHVYTDPRQWSGINC